MRAAVWTVVILAVVGGIIFGVYSLVQYDNAQELKCRSMYPEAERIYSKTDGHMCVTIHYKE